MLNATVLLGIMSSPINLRLRTQWREWASLFASHNKGVDVRFVLGQKFHQQGLRRRMPVDATFDQEPPEMVRAERDAHGDDFIFVGGREKERWQQELRAKLRQLIC